MKIEDIDKAVELNKRRESILDTIRAIELDPTVEIAIIKPYKYNVDNTP
ncbi:hypothetical protein DAC15_123 [Bacteroides phage DAC15]|nr:hypothetical protein KNU90_gp017 [Bacteroides phage DAC15]QIN96301.1 hypothetical protein DAC15_123 [Bacteroides phage DAC15]